MSTEIKGGINWSLKGSTWTIFDQTGFVDGEDWVISTAGLKTGDPLTAMAAGLFAHIATEPTSTYADIVNLIAGDIRDGNEAQIAYIGVSPYNGLVLALEGVLKQQILADAEETLDSISAKVTIEGVERTIKISPRFESVGTYNAQGEIV